MQPWLIHLGSMARIKVDLWGRFLSPCVNFSFEKLKFPRREEGRVKLVSRAIIRLALIMVRFILE